MKISKRNEYSHGVVSIAYLAKVMGSPVRVALLEIVASRDSVTCGELVALLPVSQGAVSKHMLELYKAQLIIGYKRKTCSHYSLNWERIELLGQVFALYFANMKHLKPIKGNKTDS